MPRKRILATWVVLLLTFPLLLIPDLKASPAVLWPSVVAVGLAFVTRDIYASLFLGAFAGAILLNHGNVLSAFLDLFSRYLLPALADPWNMSILVFTLLMGGLVGLLNWNGGMRSVAEFLLQGGHSRRRAEMGAYILGWIIFFDGIANSMLVGKVMRPITDRAGISREKLSFIVDSTSSPIAGVALISTWIAYEMSVIRDGLVNLANPALIESVSPYQLLVQSLPYRFYNYFILLIVLAVIWLGRDFGPMLGAERRFVNPEPEPQSSGGPGRFSRSLLGLVPLAALILSVFGGLFIRGGGLERPLSWESLITAFGTADAAKVFVESTAFTAILTLLMSAAWRPVGDSRSVIAVFFEGMMHMFLPVLILVFAWVLNGVIKELGTSAYLVSFLDKTLSPALLPALVFLVSAIVSFSTGTSWGTMAIVMPLVVPVAATLADFQFESPMFIATIGAVLAGAVFGDHCSPISDTTIISSLSSDCDHIEHVRTQLPYALAAALIALFVGYGLSAIVSPVWLLTVGSIACWALVRYAGKPSAPGAIRP